MLSILLFAFSITFFLPQKPNNHCTTPEPNIYRSPHTLVNHNYRFLVQLPTLSPISLSLMLILYVSELCRQNCNIASITFFLFCLFNPPNLHLCFIIYHVCLLGVYIIRCSISILLLLETIHTEVWVAKSFPCLK